MTVIHLPAGQSTTEAPPQNVGSAMAALLAQVPDTLAEKIRDAWSSDLSRMFQVGLAGGQRNAFTAMADQGLIPAEAVVPKPAATTSRPKFQLLFGGAR